MRNKALLLTIIGIILIVIGLIYGTLYKRIKDNNEQKKIDDSINENYDNLKKLGDKFNNDRSISYEIIFNDLNIENLYENYDNWYIELNNYKNSIINIIEYNDFLNNNCVNKTFNDSNLKSKCEIMVSTYETAVNYYVKDINKFNTIVNDYNNTIGNQNILKEYNLDNINYVDLNDDGTYTGM